VNKYTAVGLLAAAAEGKRILVVSPHGGAQRNAIDEVHRVMPEGAWLRAPGASRVTMPSGGTVSFVTPMQLRGCSADVVLVEDDRQLFDILDDLRPVIHASEYGEIIRY
jgi:hypothetical protein